jgi:hypothetical protein
MIRRRHQIVHRADKAPSGDRLQTIEASEVTVWIQTASVFLIVMVEAFLHRQYPLERVLERFERFKAKGITPASGGV